MADLRFIHAGLKDHMVGALTRSSRYVIKKMLAQLPQPCSTIVEYGAGDGVLTIELANALPKDGRIVALETNDDLIALLKGRKDERIVPLHKDVREVSEDFAVVGCAQADAVVSGIPFTFMSKADRSSIVQGTYRNLRPGGRFIVYQYSPLILPYLKAVFPKVSMVYEPRNILPYFIMVAEK